MGKLEILGAILSSSLLATILTSIFNWKLHNSNYRKEYYKKILDRRLEAFETVQSLTGKMSFQVNLGKYATPAICFDEKFYDAFIFQLATAIDKSYWLDDSTSNKLTELNVFLHNNIGIKINEKSDNQEKNEKYQKLGHENWESIREFRKELQLLINIELKTLHNVSKFFAINSKNTYRSFPILKSEFDN